VSHLSPWRYKLVLAGVGGRRTKATIGQGKALGAIRDACGLGVAEVARGWGVEPATIAALESGDLRFPSVCDLQSAVSQLWCWRAERGVRG
jgi:hypothetical protein